MSGALELDPRLERWGLSVTTVRFVRVSDSVYNGKKCELTLGLRCESGQWPDANWQLHEYDDHGVLVATSYPQWQESLDKKVRHATELVYPTADTSRFEMVFNAYSEPPELTEAGSETDGPAVAAGHEWIELPVEVSGASEQRVGAKLVGVTAEMRPQYNNQLILQVGGHVQAAEDGGDLPSGLMAEIAVVDDGAAVRSTMNVDLSRGPFDVRSFSETMTPYDHHHLRKVTARLFIR